MDNSRLVYSTEKGRITQKRHTSQHGSKKKGAGGPAVPCDGIVRIRGEVQGRKGKQVTTVTGLPATDGNLKRIAGQLKRICGSGGSIKDGCIIIQGDHREKVRTELNKQGYKVKLAGG